MTTLAKQARAEAEKQWPGSPYSEVRAQWRAGFVDGAEWAASRPRPTLDEITFTLHDATCSDRTCEPQTMGAYRRAAQRVMDLYGHAEKS